MKTGVCSYCFNPAFVAGELTMTQATELVGTRTEADCFEPLSRYWDPDRDELTQAREARRQMDGLGLETSCYTLDSDFAVYDTGATRACIDLCIERLQVAEALGTDTIRLDPKTSGVDPQSVDVDDVIARMAPAMAEIADAAESRGIRVGIENHGRLLGSVEHMVALIEQVGRPNAGINIDFTNFLAVYGQDHVEATRTFAHRVVHAHAKDMPIRDEPAVEEGWRQVPSGQWVKTSVGGDGDARWPELFRILHEAGYDGTVSLEVSDPADLPGSVAAGVTNLKRALRQVVG